MSLIIKTPIKIFVVLLVFTAFAVFGLSPISNIFKSNVNKSKASAQEPADINNDNVVDIFDLSSLLSRWGTTDVAGDLNGNGVVDIFDLSILLSKWGVVAATPTRPDATNTGVPNGVILSSVQTAYPDAVTKGYTVDAQGMVTISKDGEIYDGILFPDGVRIRAQNITIKNSRIVGGRSSFAGLLAEPISWADCRTKTLEVSGVNPPSMMILDANSLTVVNFLLEDSEIAVDEYSAYINNYMGRNTTMRRVDISGGVDAIGAYSGSAGTAAAANFRLEDSYIHDLYWSQWSPGNYNNDPVSGLKVYCGYDAAHPESTHNDGIQTHGGTGVYVLRSTLFVNAVNAPQVTSGIMLNSGGDMHIQDSHFMYGVCSINAVTGLGAPVEITNNTFYGNNGASGTGTQTDGQCAIIRPAAAGYIFSGNKWENGNLVLLKNG